jgi:FkbM family methyltransferase
MGINAEEFLKEEDLSEKVLSEIGKNGLPVAVWGFGGMITFIVDNMNRYEQQIDYIVDNNSKIWGDTFEGIPIISFEMLRERCTDCNILIGVVTRKFVDEIRNQIIRDGQFTKIYFFEMFYPFGKYARNVLATDFDRIQEAYRFLEDEKSREVYKTKLQYLISKKIGILEEVCDAESDQYMDRGLIELANMDGLFIDGGAYHGENTDEIFKRFPGTKLKSVCIDADKNNIAFLQKKYAGNTRIRVVYGALEKKNGVIYFENSGARGGKVSGEHDGEAVPAIGIDDEYGNQKVSFIKLDIEGSEKNCLLGAEAVIRRDRPVLAICIYHNLEDHWEIPLMIKRMCPDYKLYIRHYHYMGIETVVYAI